MPIEPAGQDKAGCLLRAPQDTDTIARTVTPACPAPDDLRILQKRHIALDCPAACPERRRMRKVHRVGVLVHQHFRAGYSTEHEGSMPGLMAVEIRVRAAQHLGKHLRFHLRDQAAVDFVMHRDLKSDRVHDLPAGISSRKQDRICLEYRSVLHPHLPHLPADLLQRHNTRISVEPHALLKRSDVVAECCGQWICMTIRRTEARADDLV